MNILRAKWKLISLVIGIVVIIVVVIMFAVLLLYGGATTPTGPAQNGISTNNTSTAIATSTNGTASGNGTAAYSSGGGASNIPALPGPAITINLLTPISNNVWTIGGTNSIAWDTSAGVTGEIDLVNATTKAFIGVILSETGPNQTSYSWDARSIYLARYSADKKDVVPGIYSIRIRFDGNGLGDLVSGPITITN